MMHPVTDDDTAIALGSGEVGVLATPRLIAWLEAATLGAARPHVAADRTTVGTAVRVRHRRPTRVGGEVTTTAELTSGPDEKGRLGFTMPEGLDGRYGRPTVQGDSSSAALSSARGERRSAGMVPRPSNAPTAYIYRLTFLPGRASPRTVRPPDWHDP